VTLSLRSQHPLQTLTLRSPLYFPLPTPNSTGNALV
jgi:hypothetical protein